MRQSEPRPLGSGSFPATNSQSGNPTVSILQRPRGCYSICQMSESSPSPGLQTLHSPWLYVAMAIVTVMAAYSYLDGQAFRNAANSAERARSLVEQNQELLTLLMDTGANKTGYL